jgi:hypothetical protein
MHQVQQVTSFQDAATNTTELIDKLDNCTGIVLGGKCDNDFTNMKRLSLNIQRFDRKGIKRPSFTTPNMTTIFDDLSATKVSIKSIINFELFEQYVSLIIPLPKVCSNSSVLPKTIFDSSMIQERRTSCFSNTV